MFAGRQGFLYDPGEIDVVCPRLKLFVGSRPCVPLQDEARLRFSNQACAAKDPATLTMCIVDDNVN